MSNQREAWDKVGDSFSTLTGRFKDRYQESGGTRPEDAGQKLKGAFGSIVDAVDSAANALNEMARRHKLKELLSQGLGLTGEQLAAEFVPGPADAFADHGWKAAEDQARYGDKPASS